MLGMCRGGVNSITFTTGKRHSFIGYFKFIGTDECIPIIFVGPKTDEYKLIFVGLGQAPMNIWAVRFDFDRTHIFIGDMAYIRRLTDKYRWDLEIEVSFFSLLRVPVFSFMPKLSFQLRHHCRSAHATAT
jgi:hypothetical protein